MSDPTNDSLRSLITAFGDPSRDKAASLVYVERLLDDKQLHAAYRTSWLSRKIVDIPALDALRKWREWQADQAQITAIENEEKRLGLKQKLLQCKQLARLWGGAAIYIGIKGQNPAEPLEPETVQQNGISYLTVMSRRELVCDELDMDPMSEFYGWPVKYTVSNGRTFADIHPSRLLVQIGNPLPDPWTQTGVQTGWGDSVLQAVYSAVQHADATAANIATLVFEANVDVYKFPDLMENLSSAPYRNKLLDRLTLAQAGKSITRALFTDTDEEYTRNPISFQSLPDVIQQFLILVSGAADIPLTRLIGQSPGGLNSTGEHDMKNYHDRVQSIQELEIQPALTRLDDCLIRSALGDRPSEIFYNWRPLEQMSEKEKAEIAKLKAETGNILATTGLFMSEELREVIGNQLVEDGFYPGLGDLLKKNGPQLPEFDLERRAQEAGVEALENPQPERSPVQDAEPKTLYMRRNVLNAQEILDWYRDQGLSDLYAAESLHVTIVYSKRPVDWMKIGQAWDGKMELPEGGPRMMEKFGPDGQALVLLFASSELQWRHTQAIEAGASHDYPEYQPHITISLRAQDVDLVNVKPWIGRIVLGPETFEEIDDNWQAKVIAE